MRISDWSSDVCSSDLSDDVVELGAEVHSLRKTPLPTLKSSSFSKPMLAEDCEKTERSRVLSVVAAPPGRSSPGTKAAAPAPAVVPPARVWPAARVWEIGRAHV